MSINAIEAWPEQNVVVDKEALGLPPEHPKQPSDLEMLRAEQAAIDQSYQRSFDRLWFVRTGWHRDMVKILSWTRILSWLVQIKVLCGSMLGRTREALTHLVGRGMELGRLASSSVSRLRLQKATPPMAKIVPGEPCRKPITERIRIRPPSKNDSQALRQLAHCLDTIRGTLEEKSESSLELDGNVSEMMVAVNEGKVVGFVLRKKSP